MARASGRDQRAPMERLVRVIGALNGRRDRTPLADLLTAVAPGQPHDDATRKMLQRDLDHLNALGYDIRNVAEPGHDGVFVMRARDNRLQVHLRAEQRGELLRAALAAGLDGMSRHLGGDDPTPGAASTTTASTDLDLVQRATTRSCLVHFTYKAERRTVHPARLHSGPSGWYLTGREDRPSGIVKEFVVSRMSEVTLDPPGTAEPVSDPVRRSLDPLTWEVDPPTDVVIALPAEHRVLAENLLGTPAAVEVDGSDADTDTVDGLLRLTYRVTHRQIFRYRIYELGTRVQVVSPADVRSELLAELRDLTGAR